MGFRVWGLGNIKTTRLLTPPSPTEFLHVCTFVEHGKTWGFLRAGYCRWEDVDGLLPADLGLEA